MLLASIIAASPTPAVIHAGTSAADMDPAWISALIALIAAVFGLLAWAVRWAWKILRQVGHFLDDWRGEDGRDGMSPRPGVMSRLATVEKLLDHVVAETSPNHGTSLRDMVVSTYHDVGDMKQEQAAMRGRLELFEAQRQGREGSQ